MTLKSKRQGFYERRRNALVIRRIHKANCDKPGYVGATLSIVVDGKKVGGPGALFMELKGGE